MSFKSGVKGRGSHRWWERKWWPWWVDMHRIRWTRSLEESEHEVDGMKKGADSTGEVMHI